VRTTEKKVTTDALIKHINNYIYWRSYKNCSI